jgi:two-component sensor histidine kinase
MTTIDRALLRDSWHSWIANDLGQPAGPAWLQLLWTLLFCMALAAVFTLLGFMAFASGPGAWRNLAGWAYWYGLNLQVCLCVGFTIHGLFSALRRWPGLRQRVQAWPNTPRTLFFTGVSLVGLAIGWPLGLWLAGTEVLVWFSSRNGNNLVVGSVTMSLLITFLLHHYFAARTRQLDAERRAAEAQLRLLQAQIEPHFLFNTLANVISLIDHDTPRARQMLEAFTDYLRASLGTLRHDEVPLGTELDLAQAYLSLLHTRMEDRLRYDIDAPADLRALRLPPLLLQPLVENAVHHGLEPTVDGGRVTVRARTEGGQLVLEVHDDGRGPQATPRRGPRAGQGLALDNIRQRLQARYGGAAALHLQPAEPGTLARITLPLPLPT